MSTGDLSSVSATTLDVTPDGPVGDLASIVASTPAQAAPVGDVTGIVASTPTPPACSAGDPQGDLEPFTTVTLAGSSDSTPDTWQWRQISGSTVTLAGATSQTCTYEAPGTLAGATLTFGLKVTKGGITSLEATVQHEVLYATEQVVWGGQLCPAAVYVCTDDGN